MDERVSKAMERWPDVPAAYGWLRLDRRGRWHLVDRNAPGFTEAEHGRGSLLRNDNLIDFIARNYMVDDSGSWYWQNGPQKAFVDLDAAPLIVRVMEHGGNPSNLTTHTGYPITAISRVCIGSDDVVYLSTNLGPGCIHDLDLASLEIEDVNGRMRMLLLGTWFDIETLEQSPGTALGFKPRPRDT